MLAFATFGATAYFRNQQPRVIQPGQVNIRRPLQQARQPRRRTEDEDVALGRAVSLAFNESSDLLEDYRWVPRMARANKRNCNFSFHYCDDAERAHEEMRPYQISRHDRGLGRRTPEDQIRLYLELLAEQHSDSE